MESRVEKVVVFGDFLFNTEGTSHAASHKLVLWMLLQRILPVGCVSGAENEYLSLGQMETGPQALVWVGTGKGT